MNALALKQKVQQLDNSTTFFKLLGISVVLTAIVFPLNFWFNPLVDPVVHEVPILFGLGFVAFVAMFLTFIAGGLTLTVFVLNGYLFVSPKFLNVYDRANANSILRSEHVPREMAKNIYKHILELTKNDNDPRFEELEQKYQREKNELKQEITELKTEIDGLKRMIFPHIARQNRNGFDITRRLTDLEQEKNEKIQTIGNKAQSENLSENAGVSKDNKFEEDL